MGVHVGGPMYVITVKTTELGISLQQQSTTAHIAADSSWPPRSVTLGFPPPMGQKQHPSLWISTSRMRVRGTGGGAFARIPLCAHTHTCTHAFVPSTSDGLNRHPHAHTRTHTLIPYTSGGRDRSSDAASPLLPPLLLCQRNCRSPLFTVLLYLASAFFQNFSHLQKISRYSRNFSLCPMRNDRSVTHGGFCPGCLET